MDDGHQPALQYWKPGRPEEGTTTALSSLGLPAGIRLSASGGVTLAQSIAPPFAVYRAVVNGGKPELRPVLDHDGLQQGLLEVGGPAPGGITLETVRIGAGYLLQMGSLSTDDRVLVTLDPDFRVLRASPTSVAIGFMDAIEAPAAALAMIDPGTPTLAFYTWSWFAGAP